MKPFTDRFSSRFAMLAVLFLATMYFGMTTGGFVTLNSPDGGQPIVNSQPAQPSATPCLFVEEKGPGSVWMMRCIMPALTDEH